MLFGMKTLEDEWYIVIQVYKFKRDFCIIVYCVSALSLHIESTDTMTYDF